MEKLKNVLKSIPRWCRVVFAVFPVMVVLHLLYSLSPAFAEFYVRTVGAFFRTLLAYLTNLFPISVAEGIIIFTPIAMIMMFIYGLRGSDGAIFRLFWGSLSALLTVYSLFTLTFAAGFYVRDIGDIFGIERRDITVDELYSAALITAEGANEAYRELDGRGPDSTVMGMTYSEMNKDLLTAFERVSDKYGYPVKMYSSIKPVVLSEPMTYTHISGVYTFFTGEANINVNYPDFVIPYTAAHELSHQRGVSRENEANLVAFLVCLEADDPYIRYSGYLNMFEYMASALGNVSRDKLTELYSHLDDGVMNELISYSRFFDKYRENVAADISDVVNDTYLTVMDGTDSRSYGMVVDLAVVYLIDR